ncbi:MAG: 50S ribosomal protein L25/general stress protein Ctc [Candidatus Pelagibacter sp. TMED239]|nr:MAG: 50S ribosomal protein L25/general stress protein Ctc [Candidatus Pelagibacter sp. TMED239]
MNSLEASIRNTKTKGDINSLRINGSIPAIIYGGSEANQKISLSTKKIRLLIQKENFLSNMISINIDGKIENVLPREVTYDVITDEPIHVDLLRIVKGAKIILEIPVKFINHEKSPGLKRGGVLNIVRRKVELKCPTEKIPTELIVDLENVDIGESFKISSIKLPENVTPTIQGRDFVVATLAAPTVIKEPEKPAETTEEGAEGGEGTEGDAKAAEGADGDAKSVEAGKKEGDKKEGDKQEDKKAQTEKK